MSDPVVALRAFNRFHTRFVGALEPRYMGSEMSLAEARLLYEISTRERPVASELSGALDMDRGLLSRMVSKFEARGWISRDRGTDARQRPLILTDKGHAKFAALDARTRASAEQSLAHLGQSDRVRLAAALDHVRHSLDTSPGERTFTLRIWKTGDMGMIAARQSRLYAEVYGWGLGMEIMIGEIVTDFLKKAADSRQQCWIADVEGEMAGSVVLVDAGDDVGQLRLLYTESWARGLGIGEALVQCCIDFARTAGYREVMLWTHTKLTSARKIYAGLGFELRSTETHDEFGQPEQGETWALPL